MKTFKNKIIVILLPLLLIVLSSCEDEPPTDYIEQNFVQAVLLIDEPIQNIAVTKTQPINSTFNYEDALIRDARVVIKGDGKEFELIIDPEGENGYYAEDQEYLVKPETKYELFITIGDEELYAWTETPGRTAWTTDIEDQLQFPKDTINFPDRREISWQSVPGYNFFPLSVKCLDTLEYGKYLDPPTDEMNRRIWRDWSDEEDFYEITNWAFIANNKSSVVWNIFKWFGKTEVTVYVPDFNYTMWFLQHFQANQYDDNLGNIEGGIGTFGSAHAIRDTFFLIKNQP